ncbi:DoxX family membrane protein [Paenibacillus sp. LMG 31456]|uniref:DoxX family membrane protein n=1 Tax=Paenibacillus foliorum TaxID=2654974 RepID=A0A972GLX9_9BACL|nr:DoxX family protein [Paenibacillus foliorum]NOU93221.1 DoxX family membrane protein [Paenibacillus foliorum]
MQLTAILLQILLALAFLYFGTQILLRKMEASFVHFGLPAFFNTLTGSVEIIGVFGLIIGIWFPIMAIYSGIWLGITMICGALAHLVLGRDPISKAFLSLFLLVLCAVVVLLNLSLL